MLVAAGGGVGLVADGVAGVSVTVGEGGGEAVSPGGPLGLKKTTPNTPMTARPLMAAIAFQRRFVGTGGAAGGPGIGLCTCPIPAGLGPMSLS